MSISGWEIQIGGKRDYFADSTAGQRKPPKVISSTSVLLGPLGLLGSKGRRAAPSLVFVPMIAGFPLSALWFSQVSRETNIPAL